MKRILFNFFLAIEAVLDNRLRAVLTALGIVFGVAAVIAMLAIGTGAKQDILERMKIIGTNNIEILALAELEGGSDDEEENDDGKNKKPYSPGLTLADAESIERIIPSVSKTSPEIVLNVSVVRSGILKKANCVGVKNAFFELNNLALEQGDYFHDIHFKAGMPVCIIGNNIKAKFFSNENPIGAKIKSGDTWLTVIGVIKKRFTSRKNLEDLGIRDYNADIYIPIETALLRYKNRAAVNSNMFGPSVMRGGDFVVFTDNSDDASDGGNYHQLDRLVIRVNDSKELIATSEIIARMLRRRHLDLKDYKVTVPELLLEQEQKTQNTFNIVLAFIAGISLLVGGIGIMNIMLASVLERIKEIGVRRSLGATRPDIVQQFLFESIFMSLLGGLLGVLLGVASSKIIAGIAEIPTVVSTWSIVLSFGVAATVGLVFGIVPAQRAAKLDPIKALRND